MDIVAELEHLAASKGNVSLGHVATVFGATAYVPVLIVPALIVFSPLSGIPFLPSIFGLMIALVALQMIIGKRSLWLPTWIMRREVSADQLQKALNWLKPAASWLDRTAKRRFLVLTAQPLVLIPQLACVFCGLIMPFLELVPFSSSLLAAAVICFSVSFLARDGVFVVIGGIFMTLAMGVILAVYGNAALALLSLGVTSD